MGHECDPNSFPLDERGLMIIALILKQDQRYFYVLGGMRNLAGKLG